MKIKKGYVKGHTKVNRGKYSQISQNMHNKEIILIVFTFKKA